MRFVVASSSELKSEQLSLLLGGLPQVAVRRGSLAEVGAGCDAAVVHYTVAHDRYGGTPIVGQAQVLRNSRNDGAPPIILATPPLETGAGTGTEGQAEVENHASRMLRSALAEWARSPLYPSGSAEAACVLHVEAAGLDFGDLGSMARGIRLAIAGRIGDSE